MRKAETDRGERSSLRHLAQIPGVSVLSISARRQRQRELRSSCVGHFHLNILPRRPTYSDHLSAIERPRWLFTLRLLRPSTIPTQSRLSSKPLIGPSTTSQLISSGSRFYPYSDNGGSILAIAGKDFSVIAGDTRQTEGYSIQTRYARKVWQL